MSLLSYELAVALFRASDSSPDRTIKLEGEYYVIGVTYLTNEAPLGAQVALVHVFGSVLHQHH